MTAGRRPVEIQLGPTLRALLRGELPPAESETGFGDEVHDFLPEPIPSRPDIVYMSRDIVAGITSSRDEGGEAGRGRGIPPSKPV